MSNNIELKKGLDIPISGAAARKTKKVIVPDIVAVKPTDFRGLIPRLLVREGDTVLAGSPVLSDKVSPEILFTSPVSGVVTQVVRGEKRKLLAVCIKADKEQKSEDFGSEKVSSLDGEKIKEFSSSVNAEPVKLTFVETLKTSDLAAGHNASKLVFVVRLMKDSKVVSERIQLFGAEKDIGLPKCNITAEAEISGDKADVTLKTDKFARNVLVESDLTEGNFSDNFMDIIPGEDVKLTVKAKEGVTAQALKDLYNINI